MATSTTAQTEESAAGARMQAFKEIVTAVLGLILILATLILAGLSFNMAGQQEQMEDAMGVLTLLFGLAGVVIGYYFGRLPSDAHATQAQMRTEKALEDRRSAMDTMRTAADECLAATNKMHETMEIAGVQDDPKALIAMVKDLGDRLDRMNRIFLSATAPR